MDPKHREAIAPFALAAGLHSGLNPAPFNSSALCATSALMYFRNWSTVSLTGSMPMVENEPAFLRLKAEFPKIKLNVREGQRTRRATPQGFFFAEMPAFYRKHRYAMKPIKRNGYPLIMSDQCHISARLVIRRKVSHEQTDRS